MEYDVHINKIGTDKYHIGIISWAGMDCVFEADLSSQEILVILDKYNIINNFDEL